MAAAGAVPELDDIPGWAVASAVLAPAALIGGWTVAAARQPGFDPRRETISALSTTTADERWIMSGGLALNGLAQLATAAGLSRLPRRARMLQAVSGAATLAVAALPSDRRAFAHGAAAAVTSGALGLWPSFVGTVDGRRSRSLQVGRVGSAVMAWLLVVYLVQLRFHADEDGRTTGRAERVLAAAESVWPLVVAVDMKAVSGEWANVPRGTIAGWAHLRGT